MNRKSFSFVSVVSLIALLLASSACQVGLGSAVDTQSPGITITYPPASSTIMGTFVFAGTCTDDLKVTSLEVTVKDGDGNTLKEAFSITPSDDTDTSDSTYSGTWSTELNSSSGSYVGWEFPDGAIEVSVTAYDNSGHSSGTSSRSFTVDNTAPVLLITDPTTCGSESEPASYGQIVQLTGSFYELGSKISNLVVSFYDESGNGILDSTFTNITSMSDSSPLVVARYYSSETDRSSNATVYNNYLSLFGSDNIASYEDGDNVEEKQIYFTVTAYDSAKTYTTEGDSGTGSGNKSTVFYRGTTAMQNLISGDGDIENFSLADLAAYLNETSTTYSSYAETITSITSAAQSYSTTVAETSSIADCITNDDSATGKVYLTFTLNPKNNPTYSISGFEIVSEEDAEDDTETYSSSGYRLTYTGSIVPVSINVGLDNKNILTSSISIYQLDLTALTEDEISLSDVDEAFFTVGNYERGYYDLMWTWDSTVIENSDNNADWATKYTATAEDANVSALSKSLTISSLVAGHEYVFYVVGEDIKGQSLVASNSLGYGYSGQVNATQPTIKVSGGTAENNKMSLNKFLGVDENEDAVTSLENVLYLDGTVESDIALNSLSYTLTITDKDGNELGSKSKNVTKYTYESEGSLPSDILEPYYYTTDSEESSNITYTWHITSSALASSLKSVVGNTYYVVTLEVTANNGATSTKSRSFYLDNSSPTLSLSDISVSQTKEEGSYYINPSNAFTVKGATGDNLSTSLTTWLSIEDSSGSSLYDGSSSSVTGSSWSLTVPASTLSTTTGSEATLYIYAEDEAGNVGSTSVTLLSDATCPSWTTDSQTVDGKTYSFKINKADYDKDTSWYKDSSLPVSGIFTEAESGVSKIYYWVTNPTDSSVKTADTSDLTSATGSFEPTGSTSSFAYFTNVTLGSFVASTTGTENESTEVYPNYLYLVAVDNVGNASSPAQISINVDTESPIVTCTSHSGQQYTNTVSDITEISGTFTESGASGVSSITLTVNGNSIDAVLSTNDSYASGTWSASISATDYLTSLSSGSSYPVTAKVTDKAGNSNQSSIFTLSVDTASPSVSMTTPSDGATINGAISVQGTVSYDGATPESLALYYSTKEPTSSTTLSELTQIGDAITTASSIYSFTFSSVDVKTLAGVTESSPSATLYIVPVVIDTAGNCNVYTSKSDGTKTYSYISGTNYFTYTVDQNSDRPIVQLTSMDSADSWLTSSTLKGTVTDDDGISSFYISEDGSNYTSVSVSNGSWSYTITSADSSSIPLYFKVTDTEGTTFTTGASSLFSRPYYLYSRTIESDYQSTNTWTDYGYDADSALSIKLDTASPALYTSGIVSASDYTDYSGSNTDGLVTAALVASSPSSYAISSSVYAGGETGYIKFYLPVYDKNSVTVTAAITNSNSSDVTETFKYYDEDSSSWLTASKLSLTETSSSYTDSSTSIKYTYYETSALDISEVSSSLMTITFTVTDAASNVTTSSSNFYIDNTGPDTITVTSPSSTDEITGTTTITGTASDSGVGISNIEWLVPPISVTVDGTAYTNYTDSSTASTYVTDDMLNSLSGWEDSNNTGTASVFKFKFTSSSTYDLTAYDDATNYSVTYDSDKELYTIPVFFRTTDSLGNYYIDRSYYITHNPDGDRPVTEVSYPTDSDYDTNASYITLAGTIRVSGTVEVPSGTVDVGKVYVQIGTVSDSTVTWLSTNSELTSEFSTLGGVVSASDLTSTYGTTTYVDSDWWGIAATTKTSTWNISLNSNGDLDPSDSDSTTNIAIRACAINADGKMGNWTDVYYIHVDSNAPSQSAEMRQYSDFDSTSLNSNVTTTKDYASEMYLKGTWYLVVTLSDNDSLSYSSIKVKQGSATTTFYASSEADLSDSENGVTNTLYIPIATKDMTSSSVSYTVYAEDSSGHSSSMTYTFYIDNTAPTLGTVSGNGDELSSSTENSVAESNYVYTLSGTVKDTGSGYSKVAFYFLRDGYKWDNSTGAASTKDSFTTSYILDPLVTSWSLTDDAKIAFSGLTKMSTVTGETNDVLYAAKATGSAITASTTDGTTYYSFTDESSVVSGNNHIHAGGLIYAGGAYGLITDVSGFVVTFTSDATLTDETTPTNETTVYFPYASVVDNTSTEDVSSTTANPFTFSSGDDGDLMPESITNVSTTWTWKATIHSSNIPDGPAYLVVVAYDEAGNVSTATYPVSVTNSAPRLAKLYLGTDLNSDSSWTSSEFNSYNVYTADTDAGISTTGYKTATSITTASFDAGQFTAKDKLAVVPEITGGNGSLYMVYKEGATGTTAVTGTTDGSDSSGAQLVSSTSLDVATSTSDSYLGVLNSGDSLVPFTLTSAQVWQGLTADPSSAVGVSFTFWDSTEERTAGTNSQYCVAYVTDMIIDLADDTAPTNVIDPFYWNSLTDNSIYGSSSASDYADLQGHIELGGGELSATQIPAEISSTLGYGDDPKVSGKIKLTGTAYDDKMLQTIALSVSGISFNSGTAEASFTFATYSGSAWTLTSGSSSGTKGGVIAKDGWQFQIDSETLTQSGHTVTWTLYLDTEKHKSVAAKDVTVNASATDYASKTQATSDNSSVSSTTQTNYTTQTSYYQMDVVPYIAGIKTSLSSLKKANSSVYDRTALGHYPASSSETIYVYGFNLSGGTLYDSASTANTASLTAATASSQTWYSSSAVPAGSVYSVGDISSFTSGEVIVKVNSVQSLNNVNSDSASGSYTTTTLSTTGDSSVYANYYNRQPNGDSNNLLTDDVVLDVWAINSTAGKPISGVASQPVMSINPVTEQVGFAFVDGSMFFSMGGAVGSSSDNYSYYYWNGGIDFWTSIGFTFDSAGHSYGTAAGGDIGGISTGSTSLDATAVSIDRFRLFSDRWGIGYHGAGGYYGRYNSSRIEAIGQLEKSDGTSSGTTTLAVNKERIQSPSLATSVLSDGSTNVYLAYYDQVNDEIRFKWGNMSGTSYGTSGTSNASNTGLFIDEYGPSNSVRNSDMAKYGQYYELGCTSLIAGNTTGVYANTNTYDQLTAQNYSTYFDSQSYKTGYYAGEYVSIAAWPKVVSGNSDDIVVAVWWDATNQKLMYAYNTAPTSITGGTYGTGAGWTYSSSDIFDSGIGEYCKVAIDVNGGVHIAAYDGTNGDVYYAYASSYKGTFTSVCVDSYGIIGTELNLDVALDSSSRPIPYISYYAGSSVKPKVAYRYYASTSTSASVTSGASDDAFTGAWEVSLVPTSSKVTEDHVNVGVWKGYNSTTYQSTGVITKPTTTSSSNSQTNTNSGYQSDNYAKIYGNGTANPFLGYAITSGSSGYIETAQMQ